MTIKREFRAVAGDDVSTTPSGLVGVVTVPIHASSVDINSLARPQ
jgi:hypothetical protein